MPAIANQPTTPRSAPLWRRFAALGYDSLILMALSMGYGALITSVKVALGSSGNDYHPMLQSPLYFLGWMGVLVGFFLYSWCRAGQTIGMRAWRLQVITQDSSTQKLSLKQAVLRCLLGSIGFMLLGAGYWYAWLNPHGDTWHDKLTHTKVVLVPKT